MLLVYSVSTRGASLFFNKFALIKKKYLALCLGFINCRFFIDFGIVCGVGTRL
jgi:hypothetical protein